MDIKKTVFFCLLLVFTVAGSAQKREQKKVVLNDGTVIAGTVVADSSEFLKIKIKRPQIITLNKAQVLSTGKVRHNVYNTGRTQGYSIRLSASILAGRNMSGNQGSPSVHLSNNYQFRNGLSTGFGPGIEKLDALLMPVFGEIKYTPFKTRLSPFIWIKSGYAIPLGKRQGGDYYNYNSYSEESKGGILFSAGSGLALYSWNRNAVNIGLGYRHQRLRYEEKDAWNTGYKNELITYFDRIEVQFGFIFR